MTHETAVNHAHVEFGTPETRASAIERRPPAQAQSATGMSRLDVSVVTYKPDEPLLHELIASLAQASAGVQKHLYIRENGCDPDLAARLGALPQLAPGAAFTGVSVERSAANVGFGAAHNANVARGRSDYVLILNPDCIMEPGVLGELVEIAQASPPDVGAWELRQIPYEHPKAYDPATLETRWVSGAATLFRRRAFEAAGGFDEKIFLYAEDVDLSWRLRQLGWRLLYQPRLAVTHRTYREPGEVKPVQVIEGTVSNLCLRARHGGPREVARGLALLAREIASPATFAHRSAGLARAGLRFLALWPHFARTRCAPRPELGHNFIGWDFEAHREGAFHPMRTKRERADEDEPLVSILIRTVERPALLRQALASCANQTYRNLEVVVIEDGPAKSRSVVDEFSDRLKILYQSTGNRVGRARAGNLALETAQGEWLNFLDDDDLLFADHVEVLVDAVQRSGAAGAYALAWEARHDGEREVALVTRHRQAFDRMALWHHNYLPIQSVLFQRRLFERHGGFAEDMEQLEDWNLWTRYTLDDAFTLVEKTTSKYRVPARKVEENERHARLERAYLDAVERQRHMRASFSPREIQDMATEHARRHRLLTRIEARLPRVGRLLRRWRSLA